MGVTASFTTIPVSLSLRELSDGESEQVRGWDNLIESIFDFFSGTPSMDTLKNGVSNTKDLNTVAGENKTTTHHS